MNTKYKTESEIADVVKGFEHATISRDDFKHAEHLTVALHYVSIYDLETATEKMRSGSCKLLVAVGFDLTKEMPYHETLTVFWMRTIDKFNNSKNGTSLLDKANGLVGNYDKDYPLKFYSREFLFRTKREQDLLKATFSEFRAIRGYVVPREPRKSTEHNEN